MSQIITISVGGCAVNVGISFWQQLQNFRAQSQQLNQLAYFNKFFTENQDGLAVPRTIFADSDLASNIKVSTNLKVDQNNVIGYGNSCLNLYAEGKYQEGAEISKTIQERICHQVEKCDLLSGFILLRSTLGGAGSGIGQNALSLISDFHHSKIIEEFKFMPGFDSFNQYKNLTPLQIYNTLLTDNSSVTHSNLVYTMQNKAVQKILSERADNKSEVQGYKNINKFYGECIRQHISPYIYGGHLNTNQRKRATNLIPYPRVNHLECSISNPKQQNHLWSALQYTNRLNNSSQSYDGNILAMNINLNDQKMTEKQVINAYLEWSNSTGNRFIDWIQNTIHVSITKQRKQDNKSWVIINGRKNVEWLKRIQDQFSPIFRRKAFLWHYTSRGMDEMQFVEAQSSMNDHISEYIIYDAYVEPDDM